MLVFPAVIAASGCAVEGAPSIALADPVSCGVYNGGSRASRPGQCMRLTVPEGEGYVLAPAEIGACRAADAALTCLILGPGESGVAWLPYGAETPLVDVQRAELGPDGVCPLVCGE